MKISSLLDFFTNTNKTPTQSTPTIEKGETKASNHTMQPTETTIPPLTEKKLTERTVAPKIEPPTKQTEQLFGILRKEGSK